MNNIEIYSINQQYIKYNNLIIFSLDNKPTQKILLSNIGIYIINISCQFNESAIIGLFIDDIEDSRYQTNNYNYNLIMTNYLLIHQIINIKTPKSLSIKLLSNVPTKIINLENKIVINKI